MKAIQGYYDGVKIVPEESVSLFKGQRVIIYVLEETNALEKNAIDFSRYIGKGGRMLDMDAQEYVNGLRDHDRV